MLSLPRSGRWRSFAAETVVVALIYFLLARLGQVLAIDPGNVTPIWPASGFALVVVLKLGFRSWLGLWLGNFFGNTWAFLDTGSLNDAVRTIMTGLAIGPGDLLQAFVGASLVRRFIETDRLFCRARDVIWFVGTQAVACLFSATFGVLALGFGSVISWEDFTNTWLTWFLGDGIGVILIAPWLLTLKGALVSPRDARRSGEGLLVFVLAGLSALLAFSSVGHPSLVFLPLPIVLVAAIRANQFAVSSTSILIAAIGLFYSAGSIGPFSSGDINDGLLRLQLYTSITFVTGSVVCSALREKSASEEALRVSEERYALAVRGSTDGLWDWELKTNEVVYSSRFKALLDYSEDEFPNVFESFSSHLHEEDAERVMAAVQRHLQHQEPYDIEYRLRTRLRGYRWFRARGQAIWDLSGAATRMAGSITDITEQKLAQERFRIVIEAAPNAMIVVDSRGKIQSINTATEQMFGYEREELIGEAVEILVPHQYRQQHVSHRQDFLQKPIARPMGLGRELHGQRKDGSQFPVEIGLSPIQLNDEMLVLSSIYDATKRKQAEDALVAAKEAAEQANRAKSDFLANMSHEIRTPINAIIGMSELILESETNPTQADYFKIVLDSAESLLMIINQVLDFSKIEAGRLELESIEFNLEEEVGDILKAFGQRAHAKQIELACHIRKDVPIYLRGDPVRLRQVLVNLVGNAIKFTDEGEVIVEVELQSLNRQVVSLNFTVRDTGIGIPENTRERIFAAFEQADMSTTRQYGGTGLGLAITARIIEAMNGKLWVESELGVGSTFHFTVDLQVGQYADDEDQRRRAALSGVSVIVVDDHQTNRQILAETLENWGVHVAMAESGQEAMQVLQSWSANRKELPILLGDVEMPRMDGFRLAELVRSDSQLKEMAILLATSVCRFDDASRCERLRIKGPLLKPIKRSELFAALIDAANRTVLDADRPKEGQDTPLMSRTLRILLAEDGKANQILARAMLEKWGHKVELAEDGQQAFQKWIEGQFDVILMDVQMPVMDGLEATRLIRESEKQTGTHVPIIAMTAHAIKGDRERCLEAGMDDYIAKPFRQAELSEALARHCKNKES